MTKMCHDHIVQNTETEHSTKLKNFCTSDEHFCHRNFPAQKEKPSLKVVPLVCSLLLHTLNCSLSLSLAIPSSFLLIAFASGCHQFHRQYIHSSSNFHLNVTVYAFSHTFFRSASRPPLSAADQHHGVYVSALDEHETCSNKLQLRLLAWQTHPFSPMDYY